MQTLLTSSEDYVPATITHGNIQYDVRLRLKGDHVDHLETDKWSFRIKVKDDKSIFGMKVFSIQHPKTRIYSNELLYNLMLKEEGVLAPRYSFIEVVINGENKGIYALEEHFSKELTSFTSKYGSGLVNCMLFNIRRALVFNMVKFVALTNVALFVMFNRT